MTDQPVPYGEPTPPPFGEPTVPTYGEPARRPQSPWRRIAAPLTAAGAAALKFGAIILKLKFFTFFASMIVSLGAYAWLYGWKFALGLVLLLAVHEMGHVVVLRMRGISAGLPVFLPFMGAFVAMKEQPKTAYDEALSGIAGPVAGSVGAFAVLGAGLALDSQVLMVLAYVGFLINLFNLIPVLPLDGGRTAAALSPKLWIAGVGLLLAYAFFNPSPIIILVLVLGGLESWRRWKGRDTEATRIYHALTAEQRAQIAVAYVALVAVLVWAMHAYPLPAR